ncbi:flagellar biosynthesis regulator FlaF [Marivita sp. S2033]|uniref:flagellar biosynthesis regulator FlaF n=1 Tax=Marivita sp. S2033 TaxID=3373187 RepID=UPI0039823732
MNAYSTAYHDLTSRSSTKSARDAEGEVILLVTRRLKNAWSKRGEDFPKYTEALHDNRKLWSIFAADVLTKDNALPLELKSKISYLAEFVRDYSSKALRDGRTIEPLLELNLAVLRGLSQAGKKT